MKNIGDTGNKLIRPQGLESLHIPEGIDMDKNEDGIMSKTARLDDEIQCLDEGSDMCWKAG